MDSLHTVDNYIHGNANPLHMNGRSSENNCNVYIYARTVCQSCLLWQNRRSIGWRVSSSESLWLTSPEVTMSFVVVDFSAALDSVCCIGYVRRIDGRCIEQMLQRLSVFSYQIYVISSCRLVILRLGFTLILQGLIVSELNHFQPCSQHYMLSGLLGLQSCSS